MSELKCPHCGTVFTVDDTELASIISQVRKGEFDREVNERLTEVKEHMTKEHALELTAQANDVRLKTKEEYDAQIEELKEKLAENENRIRDLKSQLDGSADKQRIAVLEATQKIEDEKHELEHSLQQEREKNQLELKAKDDLIGYYKDLKARMSTKMIGESLERHCADAFNAIRTTAFPNAEFGKDNDASSGSKGDFIYRETDENGVEIISIMFEMKNEMEETATKHKNEDFFKELDKDRNEKKCEYAVLVSLLEADSELYNSGIVDVSYAYDKMYVVRPQCFITIISLLRTAALRALEYKQELAVIREQDVDITNFEDSLMKFKNDFSRNYDLAHSHFDKAIDEIDKTIQHLQKVKDELTGSDRQLRIATNKVEDVTVKRLTKNNPTMRAKFDELRGADEAQ